MSKAQDDLALLVSFLLTIVVLVATVLITLWGLNAHQGAADDATHCTVMQGQTDSVYRNVRSIQTVEGLIFINGKPVGKGDLVCERML